MTTHSWGGVSGIVLLGGIALIGCGGALIDSDGDGTPDQLDCMPEDPDIHLDALDDHGDGSDTNCDGIDGVDGDLDGFPGNAEPDSAEFDCQDNDPEVYPGADEIDFDGIDQDCNGVDYSGDGCGSLTRIPEAEPNEGTGIASPLGTLSGGLCVTGESHCSLNSIGDRDYLRLTIEDPPQTVRFTLLWQEAVDVDLYIRGPGAAGDVVYEPISNPDGEGRQERVESELEPGDWYPWIVCPQGSSAIDFDWSLRIEQL